MTRTRSRHQRFHKQSKQCCFTKDLTKLQFWRKDLNLTNKQNMYERTSIKKFKKKKKKKKKNTFPFLDMFLSFHDCFKFFRRKTSSCQNRKRAYISDIYIYKDQYPLNGDLKLVQV